MFPEEPYFPRPCYRHIPENAENVAFYGQVTEAASGDALELIVKDQQGTIITQFAITTQGENFYAYIPFPLSGRSDISSVTGQVLLNGRLLNEITRPVADSWFDGISRTGLTLISIWMAFLASLWWLGRASTPARDSIVEGD